MREEDLRALVQDAVSRHLRGEAVTPAGQPRAHASHVILPVLAGDGIGDGRCFIEPAVPCTHCGYCQSFGH
jgi:hypothetical protein